MRGSVQLSVVLRFIFLVSATAQESLTENTFNRGKDGKVGKANIDLLKPIAGHWKGEAMGGIIEEIWSPPQHGEMLGMLRLIIDGKPSFYELMTISEKDGGLFPEDQAL